MTIPKKSRQVWRERDRQEQSRRSERRIRAIIEHKCDGSRMNNTKWLAMFDALQGLSLSSRIKFLDVEEPTDWGRVSVIRADRPSEAPRPFLEGSHFLEPVLAVEWLEINPVQRMSRSLLLEDHTVDLTPEIEKRLQAACTPYTRDGLFIRITGHVRKPDVPPNQV